MSTSTSIGSYGDLSKANFTGGFPTSKDLAPSIIFLVIYVFLAPVLIWRIASPKHRGLILIRPAIFLLVRLGMLGLRAYMSKNTYGENELIAELVMVSIGYLFLMEPVLEMWRRLVATAVSKDEAPMWVNRVSRLLKLSLLAAIFTAIGSASSISGALDDPSKMSTVIDLRKASACLALAVAVITGLALIATHITFGFDVRRTLFLVPLIISLIIISAYRMAQTFSTNPDSAIRKPVVFWVMQMVFELVVFVGLLSISIPAWFPAHKDDEIPDVEKDAQMGRTTIVRPQTAYYQQRE